MRVLVTGGSGRLGRSVVAGLAAAGEEVVSVDLARADVPGAAATVEADLRDPAEARAVLERVRPEAVVHLAAVAVPFSQPEPVIWSTNTALAFTVLDAAAAAGVRTALVASSPTVVGYGNPAGWAPQRLPLDEEHPVRPWHAYALSKVAAEAAVRMVAARDGDRLRVAAFRPCYVVAPEEWDGAPTQQGHSVRERVADPRLGAVSLYNYVDSRDAADFVLAFLRRAEDVPNGEVFFVGAQDALADAPLADLLPRHAGVPAALAAPLTGTRPAFDCTKAERLLGWTARRRWREELR